MTTEIKPAVAIFAAEPHIIPSYLIFQWDGTLEQMALIARHNPEMDTCYLQSNGSMFLKWRHSGQVLHQVILPHEYFVISFDRALQIMNNVAIAEKFKCAPFGKWE